ncbi:MAG: hypothetical protein CL434_11800 [Acidimicrobiaceae bacterium]|nr:hypothetical protein [Acidimicrobiaceae bacterium]
MGVVIVAALVVVGVSTTRDIRSFSFERNSAIGSNAIGGLPQGTPALTNAAMVQDRIEAQIEKVTNIAAELASLHAALDSLLDEAPEHPGEDATEQELQDFAEELASFVGKVNARRQMIDQTEDKLRKAQNALNQLMTSQDAKGLKQWSDESEDALKKQAEAASSSTQDDKDLTIGAPEEKVKVKPQGSKRSAAEVTSAFTECAYKNVGRPTDLDKKLRQAEKALPSKRVTTRRSLPELSKSAANIRLAECGEPVGDSTEDSDQSVGSVLLASCVNERVGSVRLRSHIQSAVRECLIQLPPMIRPGSSGNGNNAKADPDLKGDRRDREVEDDDPGQDGTTAENG